MANVGTYFATFLNQTIFPGIIQGMARRGISTNSEELMTMVGASSIVKNNNGNSLPGVTNFPGASGFPGATVVPGISGGRCTRLLAKGERRGQMCGKKAQPGSSLCSSCASVGTKRSKPKSVESPGEVEVSEPVSVNVVPFDLAQGLHKEQVHGFIVKQFEDRVVVYGRVNEGESVINTLNAEEQRQAQEMGFSLV